MAAAARFTASSCRSLWTRLVHARAGRLRRGPESAKTENSLPKDENGNEINLDGFSGTVNSIGAYFERGGFSARVSQRYRSAFTATTRSVILNTLRSTHIDAESQIDAQIGYTFDAGTLKGLTLLLQGNNLTNERAVTRQSPEVVGSAGSSDRLAALG